MKVVIIGATGATGSELLQLLLTDVAITKVVALGRSALSVQHEKLSSVIIDFDQPEQWCSYVEGSVAFSCLGTTLKAAGSKEAQYAVDFGYQYAFAAAAVKNKVPTFLLVSAAMADPKSLMFYSRMKGALENAVKLLHFDRLVVFRPGLLSRPGTNRSGEKISEVVLKLLNRLGVFKKLTPLPVKKLAKLMLYYAKQNQQGIQMVESAQMLEEAKNL